MAKAGDDSGNGRRGGCQSSTYRALLSVARAPSLGLEREIERVGGERWREVGEATVVWVLRITEMRGRGKEN
jgi:hypothetical protein